MLASFVEGEGGAASDAYALRWCLFHMKRSCSESEAVAVACALSYVQKRVESGDVGAFAGDLDLLKGRDALLLRDSLVLSRRAISLGMPLVVQLWQRLSVTLWRANAQAILQSVPPAKLDSLDLPSFVAGRSFPPLALMTQ